MCCISQRLAEHDLTWLDQISLV